ncbi:MAG: hypothetical protein C4532_08250 [Candidatus Abyssobacteria bacterium SURF_17]|jgi:hypothetical protein|uniref:DUF4345 domain-containing protein n=1 Tax=Candidatus Abyssobacteria bacterium SURF_17 TaxID=2093361 RepID=A0A419F045_9BACT|nr:MAG: hypothetical protein C4532_08250 [Candidatus Abyssubacteria bacterium SURF_17]
MTAEKAFPKGLIVLAIILIVFALGTVAFWVEVFTSGTLATSDNPCYMEHERSFPAADGYMVLCALTAAVGIFRRRSWALLFGLLTGSAIIFLGLMDTLYSLQQGIFATLSMAAAESLFICGVCLILGPVTIAYIWRNRQHLL